MIRISKDLRKKLKFEAIEKDSTMSRLLDKIVEKHYGKTKVL